MHKSETCNARADARVNGANSTLIPPGSDSLLTGVPTPDLWSNLAAAPFGHGAITPLDAQLHLTGGDQAVLRSFADLRTQLLSAMQHNGWSRIAITAPTTGCGASFTALNLALTIARIPDARAVLMDLDLRAPAIARMQAITSPGDTSHPLSGLTNISSHLLRVSNTLALGLGRGCPQNPSDILHSRRTAAVLAVTFLGCALSLLFAAMQEHHYSSSEVLQMQHAAIRDKAASSTAQESSSRRLQVIEQQVMSRGSILEMIDELGLLRDQPSMSEVEKVAAIPRARLAV